MNKLIVLLLTVCSLVATAQNVKHQTIPGTKLQMIPPAGYKLAEMFYGFQKNENAGIQVYDLSPRSYMETVIDFSKEALTAKGAVVYSYKEITVDGYQGKYAVIQGDTGYRVATAIFGDTSFCAMILAAFPETEATLEKQLQQSLLTAKYNKKAKVDPFALSYFKLNDANSKYKYAKTTGENMYIYSLNGEVKESYMKDAALTAMPISVDSNSAQKIGESLLEDMKKYGLNETEIKYKSTKPVNGFSAYEAIIYGNVAKEKHAVYHMVVVKGNRGFIMQGIAQQDFEINMQEFEKLAHTISAK